jgi:hypothetical protein
MTHVELDIDTPLSPERVISALTDFSERRPETWPGLHPSLYEVPSLGDTWAEVKERSFFAPGDSVSAQVDPGPGGGSRIHVMWNRTGVGLKGRMLAGIIKLSGGKPVAASIKLGLDKMLESERRPQPGTTPG